MKFDVKKLVVSGMLTAVAVALSTFSIPIGASRCFPVQHMVNVMAGVFLGPVYSVAIAFCTSLIRNLLGTGSLLAFPGSMVGALLCGLAYHCTGKLTAACAAEIIGTGFLGAALCYPVAAVLMGKEVALFFYVVPFLMSTLCGTAIAAVLIGVLCRSGAFGYLKRQIAAKK